MIAAVAGSLETYESGAAIISANEAVLNQDRATDQWNFFEAKSLKKNLYDLAADAGGAKAAGYKAKAQDEGVGQDEVGAVGGVESDRDGDFGFDGLAVAGRGLHEECRGQLHGRLAEAVAGGALTSDGAGLQKSLKVHDASDGPRSTEAQ